MMVFISISCYISSSESAGTRPLFLPLLSFRKPSVSSFLPTQIYDKKTCGLKMKKNQSKINWSLYLNRHMPPCLIFLLLISLKTKSLNHINLSSVKIYLIWSVLKLNNHIFCHWIIVICEFMLNIKLFYIWFIDAVKYLDLYSKTYLKWDLLGKMTPPP